MFLNGFCHYGDRIPPTADRDRDRKLARLRRRYACRDALALRRQLMQRWADFINQPWQDSHNVVRIGAA